MTILEYAMIGRYAELERLKKQRPLTPKELAVMRNLIPTVKRVEAREAREKGVMIHEHPTHAAVTPKANLQRKAAASNEE